jgi:choline kinase
MVVLAAGKGQRLRLVAEKCLGRKEKKKAVYKATEGIGELWVWGE